MKEDYEAVKMEVVCFETEDVLTESDESESQSDNIESEYPSWDV